MGKLFAGARALAVLVAIIGAFATVPYVAAILLILGGIAAIGNKPEDNLRVYLVATVLLLGAKQLEGIPAIGAVLAVIFANIGTGALGASVVGISLNLYRLTMAAFGGKAAAATGQPATA